MKMAEWEKEHDYGSKRVCKFCKHATVFADAECIQAVHCEEKAKAGAGKSVKQNLSCDLWEKKQSRANAIADAMLAERQKRHDKDNG